MACKAYQWQLTCNQQCARFQKKKTLEVGKSRCYAEHKAPQHRTSQWIKVDSFKPMLYTNTVI